MVGCLFVFFTQHKPDLSVINKTNYGETDPILTLRKYGERKKHEQGAKNRLGFTSLHSRN